MAAYPAVRRSFRWLLVLFVVTLLIPPLASSAATPAFRGEYYNNRTLSGAPALVRDDAAINFAWGAGSPGPGVAADNFSVRWTNFVSFEAGSYRFTVRTDDGVRLWVDDNLIIDHWADQPATSYTADRTLGAGYHSIRMEYYEAYGNAVAQLSWQKLSSSGSFPQWKGEYFNNTGLSGTPVLVRNDTDINFNWGNGSPGAGVPADNFSARWTRQLTFNAGTYTFTAVSDDGVRVKVDGAMVINRWVDQPATTVTGNITLNAGAHTVVVEYYERGGAAQVRVSWAGGGSSGPSVIVVDDWGAGFVRGGNLGNFHASTWGYGNHLWWMWNNTSAIYSWAKWVPTLPGAGTYEVQVYVASHNMSTTSARYRIYHNGTRNDRAISQAIYSDQWVSLGSYTFSGTGNEYVYLSGATGEPYWTRQVGFDAVRFIRVGGSSPTPTPAPSLPSCSIYPIAGFGALWNANAQVRNCLSCATEPEKSLPMGEQTFQNGVMFWRSDTDVIYVVFKDGTWQQFNDTWQEGQPETDPNIVPPAGLYQPKRGFGKLWRENAVVRSKLGWATIDERAMTGAVEPFQGGVMLWSPQLGIYAFCNDGRWIHN